MAIQDNSEGESTLCNTKITATQTKKKKSEPKTTSAAGDEVGGFSYVPHGHKSITYVMTEIETPERFAFIATKYPQNTKGRQKKKDELSWYGSEDWVRDGVLEDISKQNIKVYLSTEKNDPDNDKEQRDRYQKLLKDTTSMLMSNTNSEHINIVLDESKFLSGNDGVRIVEEIAKEYGKTVNVCQAHSHENLTLQTHDFIAGASSEHQWRNRIKDKIVKWWRK